MKVLHYLVMMCIITSMCILYGCKKVVDDNNPPEPAERNRILFCDDNWYLLGVNYPWIHYGHDFGTTAWGHDGVSADPAVAEQDFEEMAACGIRVVRWFVFADGRASPEFDENGSVTGFDSFFFDDLDAALGVAQNHGIYLILVLFDFHLCDTARVENGVQLGGHADLITNPAKRQSFIDNALTPMLSRYQTHRHILSWEVMNEPEWAMTIEGGGTVGQPVPTEAMQEFVHVIVQSVEENAPQQLVTVGSASRKWLDLWKQSGLDFYQYHYYDWMESETPFDVHYDQLGLDKPCILGEFPTKNSNINVGTYLEKAWSNYLAGSLGWSFRAGDQYSGFSCQPFMEWRQAHPDAPVDIRCP